MVHRQGAGGWGLSTGGHWLALGAGLHYIITPSPPPILKTVPLHWNSMEMGNGAGGWGGGETGLQVSRAEPSGSMCLGTVGGAPELCPACTQTRRLRETGGQGKP